MPFTSNEAKEVNKNIFETIYHAGLTSSCEMAKERKKNYLKTFFKK